MGELLERVARQQSPLDAWHELRFRARQEGELDAGYKQYEPEAAARRLAQVSDELRSGSWRPSPGISVSITKPSGGERNLGVTVLEDRIIERAVLHVIDPELLPWSFAYRRGLGVQDALRALTAAQGAGSRWVVRGDFSSCFDEIPRSRLLDRLPDLVADVGVAGTRCAPACFVPVVGETNASTRRSSAWGTSGRPPRPGR
jgi:hypothetical protein